MSLYVNTNTSSINSQRQLSKSTKALDDSRTKLASGFRINSAKDDAAGLQISDRMTAQINGLTQGNRNANDGISFAQTAEGALDEVTTMLQRMRTLAVQSVNGTNSSVERESLQQEVGDLAAEIKRIGTDTKYGKQKAVFADGTMTLQVGAYNGNNITFTTNAMSTALGGSVSTLCVGTTAGNGGTIDTIDNMLKSVDTYRAKLGAAQNRLESSISNQENVIENVSDARSRIRDVDYASETARMTQNSILQQASTSILSQANMKSQIALSLLG
jgi:flagellin